MGMYTEIYVKISFKPETPQSVIDTIAAMMGEKEDPETLPDHGLFTKARWCFMLRCSSYYHMPSCVGKFWYDDIAKQWFLLNRSDLKNYEGEIESFFDWVAPYAEQNSDKQFIGYELYEESDEPTMYYLTDKGLEIKMP
jgi:hypothetical protein